jgi:hypothetical protein
MILYRLEDRYDQKTGKKLEPVRKAAGVICDFTGEEFEYAEKCGPEYRIDYNSLDPCGGCGEGEHEFSEKWKIEIHEFLFEAPYIFKEDYTQDTTALQRMFKAAEEDPDMDRMYLDQIMRWCRVKTADRLLSEGKYTREELGLEIAYWMEEDE